MIPAIGLIVAIVTTAQAEPNVSPAVRDVSGLMVHRVESPYQSGPTLLRVLVPEAVPAGKKLPVVYVLPVEAGEESKYGDGLAAIRAANLHEAFPAYYVAPSFSQLPWYADHPKDPRIRQESHFLKVVVPFVSRTYSDSKPVLLGFSKSGYGAWSLHLRNPGLFAKAVAWDAPLMMDRPGLYGSGPIFGNQANFERYEIFRMLRNGKATSGLIHLGQSNFGPEHRRTELLLRGVPHTYRSGPRRPHRWDSGWLTEAIELGLGPGPEPQRAPVVLKGQALGGDVEVTFTPRVAFAVHSLKWKGKEFVDSFDHGRQIQSASNLDLKQPFHPETFNPTEAGSRDDGADEPTRSRVLSLRSGPDWLESRVAMAFWLQPGEESGGFPASNRTITSKHLLDKRVTLGQPGMPNVLRFDVRFSLPEDESHTYAQFEVLTGYMPEGFSEFWSFDRTTGRLEPLSDGPGEQNRPVVLATRDGAYAMGVYTRISPPPDIRGPATAAFDS